MRYFILDSVQIWTVTFFRCAATFLILLKSNKTAVCIYYVAIKRVRGKFAAPPTQVLLWSPRVSRNGHCPPRRRQCSLTLQRMLSFGYRVYLEWLCEGEAKPHLNKVRIVHFSVGKIWCQLIIKVWICGDVSSLFFWCVIACINFS